MVKKPLALGSHFFERQKDARNYITEIRNRYTDQDVSGDDLEVVLALLKRHPDFDKKVGPGVKRIFVKVLEASYGLNIRPMPCFHIERVDGSVEEFSYDKCLRGESGNLERERRLNAYRTVVDEQILEYKGQHQHRGCKMCGCTHQNDLQVDHCIQFADLIREFEQNKLELPSQFDQDPCYKKKFRVEDEKFAQDWQEFHRGHAELRILCSQCNLRRGRSSSCK